MKYSMPLLIASAVWTPFATGAEMVHSFTNPSFGGSPFNYSNLMSSANAQNKHTAPVKPEKTAPAKTNAEQFSEQMNMLIMNRLANSLVDKAFGGTDGKASDNATFNTGVNTVYLENTGTSTRVTVIDNKTGNKTVMDIPQF